MQSFLLERYFAKHEFSAKFMLSSSDCDGFPMEYVLENADDHERSLWDNLKLGYTESAGSPLLRKRISEKYQMMGPDNILVASPGELNYITMNLLVGPSDHAIVVSPSYQSLYEIIRSVGCRLSFWKPDPDSWKFDINTLKGLVKPNTKLIVINFPHNPTGSYLSVDELSEIVALAREKGIWLFSDEMYRGLMIEDGLAELPAVCDMYEKGISLWGMAKSFALAGLRIGWLASQDKSFLLRVASYKDYLSICSSAPSELLAAFALNHSEKYITPNISKIKKNLAAFCNYISKNNSTSVLHEALRPFTLPRAGSVAFVPIQYSGTSLEFSDMLVETSGIMTVPSEMFEYPGKFLRIGFGREALLGYLT